MGATRIGAPDADELVADANFLVVYRVLPCTIDVIHARQKYH
jgi:hypothetical protein